MSGQFLTALLVAAIALVLWRYVLLVAAAALLALILIGTGFIGAGHTEQSDNRPSFSKETR